jgi:flagellin-like hook-associated protein FlgL
MKLKSLVLTAFSFAYFFAQANEEKIVKSKMTSVTVYSQGAQIFQNASYSINKGINHVIIEGVSPRIDANSLQVKATGSAIILDSKYSLYYPKPEEIPLEGLPLKVRRSIDVLNDSIMEINYLIQGLQDVDQGLTQLQTVRGQAGEFLNESDRIENLLNDRHDQSETDRSRAQDLDMAQGISQMQSNQVAYEIALKSYAQSQQLSLFNYLS